MTIVVSQSSGSSSSLASLTSRIQQRGFGSDSAGAQREALNSAYRRVLGMRRWPFLETVADTFNLVAGTPSYAFSTIDSTLLHVDAIGLVDGSQNLELDFMNTQELRRRERMYAESGTPWAWTRAGLAVRFYPNPDKAYTATIDYANYPGLLESEDDVSVIPPVYDDVLIWWAVADLAVRQRDWELHQWAKGQGNEVLRGMMDDYGVRQRQNATEVVRTGEIEQVNRHTPSSWPVY